MENLDKLVLELCKLPAETGWVEFKQNKCDVDMIGEDISALANSAVVADRNYAYMIWGVDDNFHELVNTTVRLNKLKKGNQELESWLRVKLSRNADFEIHSVNIEGKHVEVLIISKAAGTPVSFDRIEYIRVGSCTKKLMEFPSLQTQLWDKLRDSRFENVHAKIDLTLDAVVEFLDCEAYFKALDMPIPSSVSKYVHYLQEEGIVVKQDNGLYAITYLGAILFAKKLSDFPRVGRKAIRIVQYEGTNRMAISKEYTANEGYAISFERSVLLIKDLLPSKEDISSVLRRTVNTIPLTVIRETIANSLVHQDFHITGAGPLVEIFANRVEVTNPGTPLVDIMRIVDNPPKSRNEKLASMMRRLNMCEELGRGWDRMVISCEREKLPAPSIHIYQESTRVSLFSSIEFANISLEEKIWSTYLHACIKFTEGDAITNSTLRERFGVPETSAGSISRLIKETLDRKQIRPLDPTTAPRYMRYIPIWA